MSDINSESKLKLTLKEVIAVVIGLASLFGIYFTLQGQVDNNSEDITSLQDEAVNPVEFQYKDELVRSSILRIEDKTNFLADDIESIKSSVEKIEQRLYEIKR
ncbi:MAG: hypothetical protein Tp123DCM300541_37 [Prokaryotic dsDNA virus sp.]|nr:MAG: hypothetical protein Tp123DCM300541_37 [Prokaryotic dsDNA virus sp.]QDP53780.1 MAG: hypothetical protein Tp125DCM6481_5 [Prokaryotic dsDNA virus sp.]|tara:strand:+ start:1019 stop:1327 length:309 start_codon:yes stop_codon:yes gene_type:complete